MKEQIEHIAKVIHDSDIADINTFPISMSECLGKHGARRTGAAIALVKAGYRKQVWISVDDRLPEESKSYLCYGFWEDDGTRGIYIVLYSCCEWMSYSDFVITHWMPLPEPPKGE
jgi:hypothetical protein